MKVPTEVLFLYILRRCVCKVEKNYEKLPAVFKIRLHITNFSFKRSVVKNFDTENSAHEGLAANKFEQSL